jgi:hypothetical protein
MVPKKFSLMALIVVFVDFNRPAHHSASHPYLVVPIEPIQVLLPKS